MFKVRKFTSQNLGPTFTLTLPVGSKPLHMRIRGSFVRLYVLVPEEPVIPPDTFATGADARPTEERVFQLVPTDGEVLPAQSHALVGPPQESGRTHFLFELIQPDVAALAKARAAQTEMTIVEATEELQQRRGGILRTN